MQYYVKQWADKTVSLIAEDGFILEDYLSVAEAVQACVKECLVWPQRVERHYSYLQASPVDFDESFLVG